MKKPVTIVYIHHERAIGGAPYSLLYLLQKIDRQKYSPQIICLREGPAPDLFRKEGFPVEIIDGPDLSHTELVWFRWWQWPRLLMRLLASLPLFLRLRRRLSSLKTGGRIIVHLNSSTLAVAALAAKSLAIPVVWHIREPLARGYFGLRRALLRRLIRGLATHVIAISQYDADLLGPCPNVTVIYNFVDFLRFDVALPPGALKRELQIAENTLIILFLGGSTPVKGAHILLQAVPTLLGTLRPAHLVIAGEITPEFRLAAMESHLSPYQNRIHLLGPREDIPTLLADTSVLVFPSLVPHFARPVIEAAAMGKPVVASDLGGVRELVVRNETGVLVPAGDSHALALAMIELAQDLPRAYRLGQQGYLLAREKFSARQNAAATFAVYEQILVQTSPSHP